MTKIYHIYAKDECLYNNLSESQFNKTWNTLNSKKTTREKKDEIKALWTDKKY